MGIIEMQRELIKQELTTLELRKGVRPNLLIVEKMVDDLFSGKAAGLPRFDFIETVPHKASDSRQYNEMMNGIGKDLFVSYAETRRLNNRMMSLESYYESNRTRINRELKELETKTEALSITALSSENKNVVGDSMNNFLLVDFKGNTDRNIPSTTAMVNLVTGDVEMSRKKDGTKKYDLSSADVQFRVTGAEEIIHLSPMQAALEDSIHDGWRSIVETDEAQEVSATFDITLEESVMASNVLLDMQAGKPCYVKLFVSADGIEFVGLERMKIVSSYQWVFDAREIKTIRFEMVKKEEDRPNGSNFEYIFGAKHIQLSENVYESESRFVSTPFLLEDREAVKRVHLETDQYVAPETSLRYYVGFDYDTNMIEWQEIKPGSYIQPDMVRRYDTEIDRMSDGYGDLMFERFGKQYYSIAKLKHKPMKNTVGLMLGRNMWLREIIKAPFTYTPVADESDSVVYQTGVHDWVRSRSAKKNYVRVQTGFDYLRTGHFHRYTTYVYSETTESFDATVRGTDHTSHAVFLNSGQIKGVNDKFSLTLVQGWNKIEVYAYARIINQEIVLDFYIPNIMSKVYASNTPLKEVSTYDLVNNVSARTHHSFAVDADNNIIVNYNPSKMDTRGDFSTGSLETYDIALSDGVEYTLSYDYSIAEETTHKIRLMAVMTKEREHIKATPRIRSYKLIVE